MSTTTPTIRIPGPAGFPLIGVLPYLSRDPCGFCLKAAAEGDGLVRLNAGPIKVYLVSHPDYVQQILVTNAANYIKGSMMDGIRLALGNGLFTSNGDFWKRQRRLMQPAFHARRIQDMVEHINKVVADGLKRWTPTIERGEPIDILTETIHLNIEIIMNTLFGATVESERSTRLLDLTNKVFHGMTERVWTFFLPRWIPTPGATAYQQAITSLDEEIYSIIATRRANPVEHEDLLGMLLSIQDEETGERMSDGQIRDEIFTLFLAGYESTASGLTWTWYLLSQHPKVAAKLREELDQVLGNCPPTYEDLPKLTYTRQVIDEAFRLYPAFPMFFRSSVDTDILGPYQLPGGSQIILSPYATHRDPRYWDNSETFDPDRFAPERFDARVRHAYYPFGKGQRMCIGEPMSLTIAQILIATIVRAYEVELAPGVVITPRYAMTYQPRHGLPLILRPRSDKH
ncbi:cytochrome P450 [Ktedonospora formicarum]|uniref:Cytochrome P450 n=1 Tax=Ktedonospora formicarum TaxID=2778364 RepID=A0A8J3MVA6_9CHLR|nr:cytochrome P450 [Ktedonospora formicarum]GHO47741.1 cytochrome P450 [Ktedonospora formicarum]